MEKDPSKEMKQAYFFRHTACEYFPCHATAHPESFNCLFCYCPLYTLGADCGGRFAYTPKGIKDCSGCLLPHRQDSYFLIAEKFPKLAELAKSQGKDSP